jgi:hypothetical protein
MRMGEDNLERAKMEMVSTSEWCVNKVLICWKVVRSTPWSNPVSS